MYKLKIGFDFLEIVNCTMAMAHLGYEFGNNNIIFKTTFGYKLEYLLRLQFFLISFLLDLNFDKFIIRLHFPFILSMLAGSKINNYVID